MNIPRDELLAELRTLDPYEFEHLVADLWEYIGWNTTVTNESQDGGVDIIARKDLPFPQKQLIQAKRYSQQNKVRREDVQQYSSLYLNRSSERDVGADVVAIVTTGNLTQPAREKAPELDVRIVTGDDLTKMLVEWDLSEIVSEYIDLSSDSNSEFHADTTRSTEDYKGTSTWATFEDFNKLAISSDHEMKLTTSIQDTTAYTLIHGRSYQNTLEERRNIHYLDGLDTQQVDRVKFIANDLGMTFLAGDEEDAVKIFDKGDGQINTHRTVSIGMRILNGIYGCSLDDAKVDVEVGGEQPQA